MNENEIMTINEEVNDQPEIVATPEVIEEESGMGTGGAMLLGGLLTIGVIAGVKGFKKLRSYLDHKKEAKKQKEFDVFLKEHSVELEDFEEPEVEESKEEEEK